jgi:hypothetical protein
MNPLKRYRGYILWGLVLTVIFMGRLLPPLLDPVWAERLTQLLAHLCGRIVGNFFYRSNCPLDRA